MDAIRTGSTSSNSPYILVIVEERVATHVARTLLNDKLRVATKYNIADTSNTMWATHGNTDGSLMDGYRLLQEVAEDDLVVACHPMQCSMTASKLNFALDHHDGEVGLQLFESAKGFEPISVAVIATGAAFDNEHEELIRESHQFLGDYLFRDLHA